MEGENEKSFNIGQKEGEYTMITIINFYVIIQQ